MSAAPLSLAVAFAGGVFGAALGGLPVFVLCGLAVIAGTGVLAATGDPGFLHLIAWGPILGPQAAFGGAGSDRLEAARRGPRQLPGVRGSQGGSSAARRLDGPLP